MLESHRGVQISRRRRVDNYELAERGEAAVSSCQIHGPLDGDGPPGGSRIHLAAIHSDGCRSGVRGTTCQKPAKAGRSREITVVKGHDPLVDLRVSSSAGLREHTVVQDYPGGIAEGANARDDRSIEITVCGREGGGRNRVRCPHGTNEHFIGSSGREVHIDVFNGQVAVLGRKDAAATRCVGPVGNAEITERRGRVVIIEALSTSLIQTIFSS